MEDPGGTMPAATTVPPAVAGEPAPAWSDGERYVLLDQLGAGGMGGVWAAYDRRLDRKVALKLLHDRYLGEADQARLAQEARAMARLAHPNVVPVFDVGEREGRTFLTMEFVRGQSLAEWLGTPRGWREIADVFAAVARGLAAAHDAGLVHRDVKPGNILLGDDGRARIADFGVSRAAAAAPAPEDGAAAETQGLVGSPAYMAPEQLRGERADARCDQFGLCVALHEALAGARPFDGADLDAQQAAIDRGPPPLRGELPAWLPPVVARGLAADAAARFPSMTALADALAGPPPSRWRRGWPLAAALAVAAVAGAVLIARGRAEVAALPPPPDCDAEAAAAFAGAWNPARRDALLAAFTSAGAAAEGARIADAVERQGVAWRAQHAATCRATRIDHTWAPDLGVLSRACLDERRLRLGYTLDALATADRLAVANGHAAVGQVLPPQPCGDADFLRTRVVPPQDPAGNRAVEAADAPVEALQIAVNLGRWEQVERDLPAVAAEVERSGDANRRVTVLDLQAKVARYRGDRPRAIALLKEAYLLARRHRDAAAAAATASMLVWVLGFEADDFAAAEDWSALALVELESAPMSQAAIGVHQAAGALAERRGDGAGAVAHQEHALAVVRGHFGATHLQTGNALVNLAAAYDVAGRTDDAITAYRSALPIIAEAWGDTLKRAHVLSHFSTVLDTRGASDEAVTVGDEAVAIGRRTGADRVDLASLLGNHGLVLAGAGRYEPAIEHLTRAHALFAADQRAGDAAQVLSNRGAAHAALAADAAHDRAAVADFTEAVRAMGAAWGATHPSIGYALTRFATLHADRGRCAAAVPLARRAAEIYGAEPDPAGTSDVQLILGRCELAAGDPARALPLLERAAALRHAHDANPRMHAEADGWLGLALLASDPIRARTLLVTARTQLAARPARFASLLAQIDAATKPAP